MNNRSITEKEISGFEAFLRGQEREDATIEKYLREVRFFGRRAKKAREQALNQMQLRFCLKKAQSEDCGRIACYSIFPCFFSCSNIDCLMR